MTEKKESQIDYDKPVAYDTDGRPLYARPANMQQQTIATQAVHLIRPTEPAKQVISPETKLKHEKSKRAHPECDLCDGEYIIATIGRHPIGLTLPIGLGVFLIALIFTLVFNLDLVVQSVKWKGESIDPMVILFPAIVFIGIIIISTYVAYYVYISNKLFLTNESLIQEIQTGIFSKKERMVSLADIEDVSYTQNGIIEQMFNYGAIRLSTEGEGTVYHFKYVSRPKRVIARLKNAVESFKNGRAIG